MNSEPISPEKKHEVESLSNHIDPKDFGSRVVHTKPHFRLRTRPIPQQEQEGNNANVRTTIKRVPFAIPTAIPTDPTALELELTHPPPVPPSMTTLLEDRSKLLYAPFDKTTFLPIFDLFLYNVSKYLGYFGYRDDAECSNDLPEDVLYEVAMNILKLLDNGDATGWSDARKKEEIEKSLLMSPSPLVPPSELKEVPSDFFAELIGSAELVLEFPKKEVDGKMKIIDYDYLEKLFKERREGGGGDQENDNDGIDDLSSLDINIIPPPSPPIAITDVAVDRNTFVVENANDPIDVSDRDPFEGVVVGNQEEYDDIPVNYEIDYDYDITP
ncbi:16558_t:CDS:2 [Entrophospora sp. SA101]|nr:7623_t:CDS:2 [Entrophospora sp. SA101]CAJ0768040.1 16558_t:CDS:2 [Entrophospora sp. SA101]CAJ0837754.1 2019_t:CDS:2 [Entrophospora sp. SA101]CAJ0900198.1 6820_t:CDS:2 [Entrophospora sp. SA101]